MMELQTHKNGTVFLIFKPIIVLLTQSTQLQIFQMFLLGNVLLV